MIPLLELCWHLFSQSRPSPWKPVLTHVYGHQWPCQIVYHPCKCVGFGLSDGEGCEWSWSSLKMFIPILRVSGVSINLPVENAS
ncbi:hypothetical protein EDC04DRAFT_2584117 [Pisolithus marmoratus]|nr:hypothetical protein EDC04DRAFT_2584117 [Pisolithus marmoratus]